jgi:ribosomal protein S18 acetylase RimI-like enzyme
MDEVRFVPTAEHYAEGFNAAVDAVARERRYIGFVEGPSLESTREFVRSILAGAGVQILAVSTDDTVVGWCDIVRNPHEGFRHVGRLGMAFLPEYRGRGLGRRLVAQTIRAAHQIGIERVELEVFASNKRAIAFYEAAGFAIEGIKSHARKLDGQYDDNIFMALLSIGGGKSR